MPGWNIKTGEITEYKLSEDRIWALFNFVFSDACKKRNTYKFGFIKSLLDNAFNGRHTETGVYYTYEELFGRFAENYWNLVVKYNLRQMRPDGKSKISQVEKILKDIADKESILACLEFDSLNDVQKQAAINQVTKECKKYVVGALYEDFEGVIYSFNLQENGLCLNPYVHEFMLKYKVELEKLNYYSWACFLEKVNDDNVLVRVIDKLDLSTPVRNDLSVYRDILREEFEQDTCFYCGKKLTNKIQVDHFIPWSFVKDDKMWNFVLSCSRCNSSKNNRIADRSYLRIIKDRNRKIQRLDNLVVQKDFVSYSDNIICQMWNYAQMSGLKEWNFK